MSALRVSGLDVRIGNLHILRNIDLEVSLENSTCSWVPTDRASRHCDIPSWAGRVTT